MEMDFIFRILFIIAAIAMFAVRIYYQNKVLPERKHETIKSNPLELVPGVIAALTTIVFGLEYILAPGFFQFTYIFRYPDWLRWLGFAMLTLGILLLWFAHYHLGRSFSSFVAMKQGQAFVNTGPYRYIRHPIYTAYFLNYLGGGLLASNIVLTLVPEICFCIMVILRIGKEEDMLLAEFGEQYQAYMSKTGRFLPFI
jgi:protein-S-isoprenylcysteine O-methyltransferase Ste14